MVEDDMEGTEGTELNLLVDELKRLVAKPEFRIQLDDLVVTEVRGLAKQVAAQEFSMGMSVEETEFRRRVLCYEDATVRVAKVLGVLGRWGDDAQLSNALDAILYVFTHTEIAEPASGYTAWLRLRGYPAVMLFTAYGLSLTRAERWSALHRLFVCPAPRAGSDGEESNLVDNLFGPAWEGGDERLWRMLEGASDRKTPLSDHLFEILAEWSHDYIGIVRDFENLYDLWEILASLSFSERYSLASLETDDRVDRTWIPFGRNVWRSRSRREVLDRIQGEKLKTTLLDAGFGNGDSTFFDAAIKSSSAWVGRSQWW